MTGCLGNSGQSSGWHFRAVRDDVSAVWFTQSTENPGGPESKERMFTAANRTVAAEVTSPDNIELEEAGNIWVGSPVGNEVLVVNPDSGAVQSVFQPTPGKAALWRPSGDAGCRPASARSNCWVRPPGGRCPAC